MPQTDHATDTPLARWANQLSEREMPVLNNTVQQLCSISSDRGASANDLAGVVLRDASMTSGVLRIANSAHYNRSGREINTISRAVVMLGFDTVRSIGLSQVLIDTFLTGEARSHLVALMRQSVYAAVQAKLIAQQAGDEAPEEIFIAALLYRLGEIAFWAYARDEEAQALERALTETDALRAEKQTLGFELRELSLALCRQWRLGSVVEDALRAPRDAPAKDRSGGVQLGHWLERAVREEGWGSPEVSRVSQAIARFTRRSLAQTKDFLERSRNELNRAAEAFGMRFDEMGAETVREEVHPDNGPRRPAPILQLKILRELSSVLEQKPDVQIVLDMIMEGIYRGIAMDRTVLLLLSPDRKELRLKYALGGRSDTMAEEMQLRLEAAECAPLRVVLEQRNTLWCNSARPQAPDPALAKRLAEDFFVGALTVRGKNIGLIYADCRLNKRPLDAESYEAFRHFLQQGNLALGHLMA